MGELRFGVTVNDFLYKKKEYEIKAVPARREASKPLFEERSDAEKVCETLFLG